MFRKKTSISRKYIDLIKWQSREEKSLRHVAMVAKFLDDNKPKWIRTVSNFIDLIQFHLICQMLKKFLGWIRKDGI